MPNLAMRMPLLRMYERNSRLTKTASCAHQPGCRASMMLERFRTMGLGVRRDASMRCTMAWFKSLCNHASLISLSTLLFSSSCRCRRNMTWSAGLKFGGHGSQRRKYSASCTTGPWYTACPSWRMSTSSNIAKISEEGWWMVQRTGTPAMARSFNARVSVNAAYESRPLNGSSRKSSLGSVMSSMPTDTRFFSPPEMPFNNAEPTMVSAQRLRPSVCNIVSTKWARSSLVPPRRKYAEKRMHSRGVSVAMRRSSCMT
mmetsp:Transcript_8168/g.23315  ORF Transcript_8168/g.23315 Transcript_8168/m.23315 type:complete len:257 (+) Transcript_8168:874-1644(+)